MKIYILLWHNDDPSHGIEAAYYSKADAQDEADRLTHLEHYLQFTVEETELI